jgi:hypothetical protein
MNCQAKPVDANMATRPTLARSRLGTTGHAGRSRLATESGSLDPTTPCKNLVKRPNSCAESAESQMPVEKIVYPPGGLTYRWYFGWLVIQHRRSPVNEDHLKYSGLTQDELRAEIGRALMSEAIYGASLNDDDYRRFGANWFMSFRQTVKTAICKPEVLAQLSGPNKDRNTIIGVLVNVFLAAGMKCPVPLGSLAAAVANYGSVLLCQSSDTTDTDAV